MIHGLLVECVSLLEFCEVVIALRDRQKADPGGQGFECPFQDSFRLGGVFITEVEGCQADPGFWCLRPQQHRPLELLFCKIGLACGQVDLPEPEEVTEVCGILRDGLTRQTDSTFRIFALQSDVTGDPLDITDHDI